MGIRFYCSNCDRRLHVKDFLAGKRGICPHCDESITIPLKSTIGDEESLESENSAEAFSDVADASAKADRSKVLANKTVAKASSKKTAVKEATGTEAGGKQSSAAIESSSEASSGSSSDDSLVEIQAVDESNVEMDPIAAGPHLIWYVRPPSGGQYGPAEGELMRQWVAEGRVSADSLVWQEGWEEWRAASEIFPQLAPPPSPQPARPARKKATKQPDPEVISSGLGDEVKVDRSKIKMLEYRLNRSRGRGKEIVVISMLGILCVVLVVVLGFVIMKQF